MTRNPEKISVVRLPTPDTFWQRFVKQPYGYEAGIAFFSAFAGPASAWAFYKRGDVIPGIMILIGSLGVVLFACAKTWVLYHEQCREESMHDLEGCLETLVSALRSVSKDGSDHGLRAAIFAPSAKNGHLVQLMSYVGDGRAGDTKGRLLGVATGTIGLAFRLNASILAKRSGDSVEDYRRELVTFWAFTKAEAEMRDPEARSWFALPIEIVQDKAQRTPDAEGEDGEPEDLGIPPSGILYLDSTDESFFDDTQRTDFIEYASLGIARFCEKRYSFNIVTA